MREHIMKIMLKEVLLDALKSFQLSSRLNYLL